MSLESYRKSLSQQEEETHQPSVRNERKAQADYPHKNVSRTDSSGFGVCGFVLSLAALFSLSISPLAFVFQIILSVLAVIFSVMGLFTKGRQYAIVGLTVGAIQLVAYIIFFNKLASLGSHHF